MPGSQDVIKKRSRDQTIAGRSCQSNQKKTFVSSTGKASQVCFSPQQNNVRVLVKLVCVSV